jgi:hypothetical protein
VGGEGGAGLGKEYAPIFRRRGMAVRGLAPRSLGARDFEGEAESGGAFQRLGEEGVRRGPIATLSQKAGAQTFALRQQ